MADMAESAAILTRQQSRALHRRVAALGFSKLNHIFSRVERRALARQYGHAAARGVVGHPVVDVIAREVQKLLEPVTVPPLPEFVETVEVAHDHAETTTGQE